MWPRFLSSTYPLESHLFVISKISLRIIGFYPETPRNSGLIFWAGLNIMVLVSGIIAEFYYGIHFLSIDVLEALDALCPVGSSILGVIKIFFIWLYRREFAELINRIRVLMDTEVTSRKLAIKRKYFTLATRLTAMVFFLSSSTTVAYAARPLVVNLVRYINGQDFIFETPFKMMFPQKMLAMPIYPITYALVAWHGFLTGISFTGTDSFFLAFCLYCTVLLKCLQEDIKYVLTERDENVDDDEECCAKLSLLIDRHNELYAMTQKFSKIVVVITLAHFVTSSMIICLSLIDLLLNSGFGIIVYTVHTCAVVTEVFLYCYGGSEIIESSEAIGTVAYSSQWYMRDLRIQKMVLLCIERSQRSFVINVPFFSPSMPVLAATANPPYSNIQPELCLMHEAQTVTTDTTSAAIKTTTITATTTTTCTQSLTNEHSFKCQQ